MSAKKKSVPVKRDWRQENAKLVNRGNLRLIIDEEIYTQWQTLAAKKKLSAKNFIPTI
ncbi:MAG: hypothetical protein LBP75_05975 [Planctomycetota bacterium]|jgi:NADPH:quinone reductase-like Zn-dependent oxidoreductase|nr:hypothetical protein [Planctomycetota bacterium]